MGSVVSSLVGSLLLVFYVVTVAVTVFAIVLERRDPVKAMSWILVLVLVPVLGFVIYMTFGRNYRKRKLFGRKAMYDVLQTDKLSSQQVDVINSPVLKGYPSITNNRETITLLLNNSRSMLTAGNKVELLNDGRDVFAAMIRSMEAATSSIHVQFYIICDDRIGNILKDTLIRKAREGVEVRLVFDDVGSWNLGRRYIRPLVEAGVEVYKFMPVLFPWITSKINYRNHRKIVVVDGREGFMGGYNVADRYITGDKFGYWRDTHIRINGEAVHYLQQSFASDWFFVCGKELTDKKYFPEVKPSGNEFVQIATSGADSPWASIMQAYFSAVTNARKHIYISTPYFLPNEALRTALEVSALGGIDVRLMIPSRSDSTIVYWATRSFIAEMLDANVKVYMYNKGFSHSKIMMVDSDMSSVGSANMDIRSFEDNFEVSAFIYDPRITKELETRYFEDLAHSTLLTKEEWARRSLLHRMYEGFSRLLSPLL